MRVFCPNRTALLLASIYFISPALLQAANSTSTVLFTTSDQSIWGSSGAPGIDLVDEFYGIDQTLAFPSPFNPLNLGVGYIGMSTDIRLGTEIDFSFDSGSVNAIVPYSAGLEFSYAEFNTGVPNPVVTLTPIKSFTSTTILDTAGQQQVVSASLETTTPNLQFAADLVAEITPTVFGGGCVDLLFDDVCGSFSQPIPITPPPLSLVELNKNNSGEIKLLPQLQELLDGGDAVLETALDVAETANNVKDAVESAQERYPDNHPDPDLRGKLLSPTERTKNVLNDLFDISIGDPPPVASVEVRRPELGSTGGAVGEAIQTQQAVDDFLDVEIDVDGLLFNLGLLPIPLEIDVTIDAGVAQASLHGNLLDITLKPSLELAQQFSLTPTLTMDLVFDRPIMVAKNDEALALSNTLNGLIVGGPNADEVNLEWDGAALDVTPTYTLSATLSQVLNLDYQLNLDLTALEASFVLDIVGHDIIDESIGPFLEDTFGLAGGSIFDLCDGLGCSSFNFGDWGAPVTGATITLFPTEGVFTGPTPGTGGPAAWSDAANWQGGAIGGNSNNVVIDYDNLSDSANPFSEVTIGDGDLTIMESYEVGNVAIGEGLRENGNLINQLVLTIEQDGTLYQTGATAFVNAGRIDLSGDLGITGEVSGGGSIIMSGGEINGILRNESDVMVDRNAPLIINGQFIVGIGTINAQDQFSIGPNSNVGGYLFGDQITLNLTNVSTTVNEGFLGAFDGFLDLNSSGPEFYTIQQQGRGEIWVGNGIVTLDHTSTSCTGSLCDTVAVIGGRLVAGGGGLIQSNDTLLLDEVWLEGSGSVSADTLILAETSGRGTTIRNDSQLIGNSVLIGGDSGDLLTTLEGNGVLQLNGGTIEAWDAFGAYLLNDTGHTISGIGGIAVTSFLTIENRGAIGAVGGFFDINAFSSTSTTVINSGTFFGNGGTSALRLFEGLFDLSAGVMYAAAGGGVDVIQTASLVGGDTGSPGGTWIAESGGVIQLRDAPQQWHDLYNNGLLDAASITLQGNTSEFLLGQVGMLSVPLEERLEVIGSSGVLRLIDKQFDTTVGGTVAGDLAVQGELELGQNALLSAGDLDIAANAILHGNGSIVPGSIHLADNATLSATGGTLAVTGALSGTHTGSRTFSAENGAILDLNLTGCGANGNPCPFVDVGGGIVELRNSTWIVDADDTNAEIRISGLGLLANVTRLVNTNLQLSVGAVSGLDAKFSLNDDPLLLANTLTELNNSTLLLEGAVFQPANTLALNNGSTLLIGTDAEPAGLYRAIGQDLDIGVDGPTSLVRLTGGSLDVEDITIGANSSLEGYGPVGFVGTRQLINNGRISADGGELSFAEYAITGNGVIEVAALDASNQAGTGVLRLIDSSIEDATLTLGRGAAIAGNGVFEDVTLTNGGFFVVDAPFCAFGSGSGCNAASFTATAPGAASIHNLADGRMQILDQTLVLNNVVVNNDAGAVIEIASKDNGVPVGQRLWSVLELNDSIINGGELRVIREPGGTVTPNTPFAFVQAVGGQSELNNVDLYIGPEADVTAGSFATIDTPPTLTINMGAGSIVNNGALGSLFFATLEINGPSPNGGTISGAGEIFAGTGSVVKLSNVNLDGVTLNFGNTGGQIVDVAESTFNNLAIDGIGSFEIQSGAIATLVGNVNIIDRDGEILVKNGGIVRISEGDTKFVLEDPADPTSNLIPGGALPFSISGEGALAVETGGIVEGVTQNSSFIVQKLDMQGGTIKASAGDVIVQGDFTGSGTIEGAVETEGLVAIDQINANQFRNRGQAQKFAFLNPQLNTQINADFDNQGAGTVTVGASAAGVGEQFVITGTSHTNAGNIQVNNGSIIVNGDLSNSGAFSATQSSTVDFNNAITNTGDLNIAASTVTFTGGLTNDGGNVNVTSGVSLLSGDITNLGTVIVSGNGQATFWGLAGGSTLLNDGEFRVSDGSEATLFVDVIGAGSYTGLGTKRFEAGFSPGSSPGLVTAEGDSMFGAGASIEMEIAGVELGESYDHYRVDGKLGLGGTLNVKLLDGFTPEEGDEFDLFDALEFGGAFASLNFGDAALASGLRWNFSQLNSTGTLSVSAVPLPAGVWLMLSGLVGFGVFRRRQAA